MRVVMSKKQTKRRSAKTLKEGWLLHSTDQTAMVSKGIFTWVSVGRGRGAIYFEIYQETFITSLILDMGMRNYLLED